MKRLISRIYKYINRSYSNKKTSYLIKNWQTVCTDITEKDLWKTNNKWKGAQHNHYGNENWNHNAIIVYPVEWLKLRRLPVPNIRGYIKHWNFVNC